MLTQRIAKSYFFMRKDIRAEAAQAQLMASLAAFTQHHQELKAEIEDKEIQEFLSFIDMALADYKKLVDKPYTRRTGKEVLILSETLLEVCQSIIDKIRQASKPDTIGLVDISGRQLMLSQRIAKYYIAYQAGLQDPSSVKKLNTAVQEFESALKILKDSKENTAQINSELARVGDLWEIVRTFFLDLEKGGLPVTVFSTTDNITEEMNAITGMYERIAITK